MARKKPLTQMQQDLRDRYMRERRRIQSAIYRSRKKGTEIKISLPKIPKKITEKSISRLEKILPRKKEYKEKKPKIDITHELVKFEAQQLIEQEYERRRLQSQEPEFQDRKIKTFDETQYDDEDEYEEIEIKTPSGKKKINPVTGQIISEEYSIADRSILDDMLDEIDTLPDGAWGPKRTWMDFTQYKDQIKSALTSAFQSAVENGTVQQFNDYLYDNENRFFGACEDIRHYKEIEKKFNELLEIANGGALSIDKRKEYEDFYTYSGDVIDPELYE